jgi:hypothetical protein
MMVQPKASLLVLFERNHELTISSSPNRTKLFSPALVTALIFIPFIFEF